MKLQRCCKEKSGKRGLHMKAYLILENGTIFEGEHFGAQGDAPGEVIFNTCMTGYQEMLTDPANKGLLVAMTYPLLGNYGVNGEDDESDKTAVKGLIVREYCEKPSNFRSTGTLDEYLKANGIVGISGVDTRRLTRALRDSGAMRAVITTNEGFDTSTLKACAIEPNIAHGSQYHVAGEGKKVALVDFGVRRSFVSQLSARGYDVMVFPSDTTAEVLSGFDGIILSGGPGAPQDYGDGIALAKRLLEEETPVLGVGLGHQLLALASGAAVEHLPHGHHGVNHPVLDKATGRTYLTWQNHGWTVKTGSLPEGQITDVNINDQSIEGASFAPHAIGVQFHPVALENATATGFVFARFETLMGGGVHA